MKKRTPLTEQEWRSVAADLDAAKQSLSKVFAKVNGRMPLKVPGLIDRKIIGLNAVYLALENVACDQLGDDVGMQVMKSEGLEV